jgi:hypothetical protein
MVVAILALVVLVVAPFLFFYGTFTLDTSKTWMLVGTILWFVSSPFWLGRKET